MLLLHHLISARHSILAIASAVALLSMVPWLVKMQPNQRKWTKSLLIILALLTFDAYFRIGSALNNTNFLVGDGLAPFSLFDQIYHGEAVDIARQQPVAAWLASKIIALLAPTENFMKLFSYYSAFSALFATLSIANTYIIARRWLGIYEAFVPATLLSLNASYFLASQFPNPTQIYGFIFLNWLLALDFGRRNCCYYILSVAIGLLATLVRWEGALLVVLSSFVAIYDARKYHLDLRMTIGALAVAAFGLIAIVGAHSIGSSVPFAFLKNTNALTITDTFISASFEEKLQRLTGSLNWKFEKVNALSTNMTVFGLIFSIAGFFALPKKDQLVKLLILYFLSYELVMFIFTIIVPVGNITRPLHVEIFNTAPVHRYYQIYSPVLSILAYIGLKNLVMSSLSSRIGVITGIGLFLLFVTHQIVTRNNTYRQIYFPTSRAGAVKDIVDVAQELRNLKIRNRDIAIVARVGEQYEFLDLLTSPISNYSFGAFHFAILSGNNRVNCVGWDLVDPNRFCSKISGSNIADLNHAPLGGTYALVVVRRGPNNSCRDMALPFVYENSSYCLLGPP